MGAGIAYVTASAGLEVVLIDRDQESADKGKALFGEADLEPDRQGPRQERRPRRAARPHQAERRLRRSRGLRSRRRGGVRGPRRQGRGDAQGAGGVGPDVIFASNTSTLPITSLAETSLEPENFVGIHFFSPVDRMMLVEIIMGGKTGGKALATAIDFVRAIKKTPIVVNDCRGFFANRCVGNYIREGHLMLMEGVPPAMIENAAQDGGHAGRAADPQRRGRRSISAGRFCRRPRRISGPTRSIRRRRSCSRRWSSKEQRLGRKNGKGFYDYPERGLEDACGRASARSPARRSIRIRSASRNSRTASSYTQALEAARCMEEKVVTDPREADVGSILGFGFAPFTGGVLSLIDGMGAKAFVARAQELAAKYGDRFAPSAGLKEMAAKGERFYGKAAKAQAA